ncbi:hypothetical protein GNF10_35065 [Nostoc sp. UCD121]|uniref:hypothetical protein n=1 Tax=unclassified Nostoc TaxID=2593658 RepID=UPI001623CDE5|nr:MULTISPECIES: hypothetical protein [unclassified Nostoc]MBC1225418.1 hypothetical protein [Nostoc sp. UCD120]MBC1281012.1 hypothetical protein [Nostoc sp. UCD121]
MPHLPNGDTTKSNGKIAAVKITGTNTNQYGVGATATVKYQVKNDNNQYVDERKTVNINPQTNQEVRSPNKSDFSVTNNSGGTINYEWILT